MKKLVFFLFIALLAALAYVERHRVSDQWLYKEARDYKILSDAELRKAEDIANKNLSILRDMEFEIEDSESSFDKINRLEEISHAMEDHADVLNQIDREVLIRKGDDAAMYIIFIGVPVLLVLGLFIPGAKWAGKLFKDVFFAEGIPRKNRRAKSGAKIRSVNGTMPHMSELQKGNTNKQQVIDWFGPPAQKVMFTEVEAWTYIFETSGKAKTQDNKPAPRNSYHSCIILFKGNTVYDYSIQVMLGFGKPES